MSLIPGHEPSPFGYIDPTAGGIALLAILGGAAGGLVGVGLFGAA